MKNLNKVIINDLIPLFEIDSIEGAASYSELCEATCSNIFAYSPYKLRIEREEFLHFQEYADALKEGLQKEITITEAVELCSELSVLYNSIIHRCWQAFVDSFQIDSEPGKFIIGQKLIVESFVKELKK